MNIAIKDFSVAMNVKTRGIEFEVKDSSKRHLGDVIINTRGLTWCKGRTTRKNGINVTWKTFIEWMES